MTKQISSLEQIAADIKEKNVCPDLAASSTNLVMGDGDENADIVFIGEAPGKNEDEQGLPFVGAAGKFLNEMLAGIGMNRSDVYITNIVKYRPPNNRDPLPEEKKAFWPYLVQQLEIIQPKIVVTLGRHSMEYFLPDMKISQIHGQPKRIKFFKNTRLAGDEGVSAKQGAVEQRTEPYGKYSEGVADTATKQRATSNIRAGGSADSQDITSVIILPLYHPAAALYNGGMRETLIEDFSKLPIILSKITERKI